MPHPFPPGVRAKSAPRRAFALAVGLHGLVCMTPRARKRPPVVHGPPAWVAATPVADWMTCAVVTVRPEATVAEAGALLRTHGIRHLPVVDEAGRVVGIVTDRDLRQLAFAPHVFDQLGWQAAGLQAMPVREVMTWGVVSLQATSDLRSAARLMHERRLGALPVVDAGGRLVGILTEDDLLRALDAVLGARLHAVQPIGERRAD